MPIPPLIASQQTVGNIGLFYVCFRLSRLGWNVMPTARNAKGVDILIYSQDASRKRTIQVKTLSEGSPVPLNNKLDHLFADFVVVCRHVMRETQVQPCRPVTVLAFVGDRSGPFVARVFAALRDGRSGRGPGPSPLECLLLAGHAGVSTDAGAAIFGLNPDAGGLPAWQVVYGLRNGDAFPGIVTEDTGIFTAARRHGLAVEAFDVLLPEPAFPFFVAGLGHEIQQSQYSYGYPDGDGDCNCVTWIERLGLPLLTGRMDEFMALPGRASYPSRRFGRCL